jgi:hypothetical protein
MLQTPKQERLKKERKRKRTADLEIFALSACAYQTPRFVLNIVEHFGVSLLSIHCETAVCFTGL